ncbi:nitrate reductase [Rhodobacterales bacterium 52_120_T64]|nr:nitrate reductase [Rhodobacterales bacterium 52_120_T64]
MNQVCTTCPYCGVGCGLIATPSGEITGDKNHPANLGRLCSKGAALGETLDLDGRLLDPEIDGKPANWDKALDLVASKFGDAVREHGPDSVAFYVSGQLLTEDYYVANKLMKGYIGSANIDTNSRLCMASSVAGHKRAFGTDTVPVDYTDLEEADVIVLVGSNLAWCHPVLFQRILAAKAQRPSLTIITVDPRKTATGKTADLHLSIRPDGDTALFNGLLVEIDKRGAVDQEYLDAHVNGFDASIAMAKTSDSADTGLSDADLRSFYDLWIGAEKVVTLFSQGVNQSSAGTDKVNAIINCHLATGRIGRAGMGPFSVTGQPNAMGGREVGGLANMLACHLDIENPSHRDTVQSAWQSPTICAKPGLKAVDLFQACEQGKIKALWIISTNPAVSMPDADAVTRAIENVPFTVVTDVTHTDTTALADVLLPATAWGEKSGTVTNSERRISRQRAFLPTPGNAKPDWEIICEVAIRMGWRDAFSYSSPADIFREYADLSGKAAKHGRDFDISGLADLNDTEYENFEPLQWPVVDKTKTGNRFFEDGEFYHTDAKAQMLPVSSPLSQPDAIGMFRLNTGRIRDQWHTMTRSGKSARLSQHLAEPFAEVHPDDAKLIGTKETELLEITSPQGRVVVRVLLSANVQRGTVFVPIHWSKDNASQGVVNSLVAGGCDPISGQPALKGSRVQLRPYQTKWYGFAASASQLQPHRGYSVVARTSTGWSSEIAGRSTPEDWEKEARIALGTNTGEVSILHDSARGVVRAAVFDGPVLKGLFFASPEPVEVARAHAISQIDTEVSALSALAGLPMLDQPNPGRTICACFDVGINTLRSAIYDGATNVVALGRCTAAGTNCGSCKSELQTLIDTTPILTAAE